MVGDSCVPAMKCRVKARNLDHFRSAHHEHSDRREIVRLVQWGQRTELFEPLQHISIDRDCSIIVRTAVNDAVSDRRKLNFLRVAQPIARGSDRRRDIRDFLRRVRFVD
jgi:hypothetical protein